MPDPATPMNGGMGMDDRAMALETLSMLKHEVADYTRAATECASEGLRDALLRMRSEAERAQRDLWRLASQKGWYVPSAPADPQEVAGLARQLGLAETQPVRV